MHGLGNLYWLCKKRFAMQFLPTERNGFSKVPSQHPHKIIVLIASGRLSYFRNEEIFRRGR